MTGELIRQVEARLSDEPFKPREADFALADYDVGCDRLQQDIAACWEEALRKLRDWRHTNAVSWAYTYRCVQNRRYWNLLAGPFPHSSAGSNPGPCEVLSDEVREVFAARNLDYLRSSQENGK